jgi:hypothetical protein
MLMTVSFVLMTMMQIGIVRVFVPHRLVLMPMRVRFCYQPLVVVLVMLVMNVTVLVQNGLVDVFVFVPLRQMEP